MDRRVRSLWLALLLSLGACGDDGPLLDVTVSGLSADIRSLRVQPSLGASTPMAQSLYQGLGSFLVRLPASARGPVSVRVTGLGTDGCPLAEGQGQAEVDGPGRYPLSIALVRLGMPGCGLVHVELSGRGSGRVTSDPPGIDCPGRCGATFAPGTSITLSSTPDDKSLLRAWSGACAGTDLCRVISRNEQTQVGAAFYFTFSFANVWASSTGDVWAAGGLLEPIPLLQRRGGKWERAPGIEEARGIWGTSPTDVWCASGPGLWHWNGDSWSRQFVSMLDTPFTAIWGSAPDDVWATTYKPPTTWRWGDMTRSCGSP